MGIRLSDQAFFGMTFWRLLHTETVHVTFAFATNISPQYTFCISQWSQHMWQYSVSKNTVLWLLAFSVSLHWNNISCSHSDDNLHKIVTLNFIRTALSDLIWGSSWSQAPIFLLQICFWTAVFLLQILLQILFRLDHHCYKDEHCKCLEIWCAQTKAQVQLISVMVDSPLVISIFNYRLSNMCGIMQAFNYLQAFNRRLSTGF